MTPPLRVLFRDDDLVVVDKPAGLVVHPAPGHDEPTMVDALAELLGGGPPERPGIVHRLDKDTSGLLVAARNEEARRALAAQVQARTVGREYVALVEGRPASRTGTIDAPIGRSHRAPERMAVAGRAAREARTHFRAIEALPRDTLLEVRLETGRTHQIRAHFAALGHPLVGDPRYGHPGRHGLGRQFLHSSRLRFRHPRSGESMELRSPLPDDLEQALERARRSDRGSG